MLVFIVCFYTYVIAYQLHNQYSVIFVWQDWLKNPNWCTFMCMVKRACFGFIILKNLVKIWKNKFDHQLFLEEADSIFIFPLLLCRERRDKQGHMSVTQLICL